MALADIVISIILLLSLTPPTAALAPAPAPAPPAVNLADLLAHAGPFSTFLAYIRDHTQVIEAFQDRATATKAASGITIFAPSDSAFSSLDTSPPLSNLTRDQLQSLLLFHALPHFHTLADLSKNLSGTAAATLAGDRQDYSLNITDLSGTITVDSGWTRTAVTSSVYSASPVAVYAVGHVLIPQAIFGAAPPIPPPPPQSAALPPKGPRVDDDDHEGPTPEPGKPKDNHDDSSSSRASCIGAAALVVAYLLALVISSGMVLNVGF